MSVASDAECVDLRYSPGGVPQRPGEALSCPQCPYRMGLEALPVASRLPPSLPLGVGVKGCAPPRI